MAFIEGDSPVITNQNGGLCQLGKRYGMQKKSDVIRAFLCLSEQDPTREPCVVDVAELSEVSLGYAHNVIKEFRLNGHQCVEDPAATASRQNKRKKEHAKIGPELALTLLALRSEDHRKTLLQHVQDLKDLYDITLSHNCIDQFFKKRFEFKGSLRKASLVPVDKFKPENVQKHVVFMNKLSIRTKLLTR